MGAAISRQYEQGRQGEQAPAPAQQGPIPQFGLAPYGNAARQADLSLGSGQCESGQDESWSDPGGGQESAPRGVVHFEHDSHQLDAGDKTVLRDLVEGLEADGCDMTNTAIRVEGFADRTGTEKHNQGLSKRRALAVAKFIERKSGLLAAITEGRGEVDTEDLAHARRVDVWVERALSSVNDEYSPCALCVRDPDPSHPEFRSTYRYTHAVLQAWSAGGNKASGETVGEETFKPELKHWIASFGWLSSATATRLHDEYQGENINEVTQKAELFRHVGYRNSLDEECPGCGKKSGARGGPIRILGGPKR